MKKTAASLLLQSVALELQPFAFVRTPGHKQFDRSTENRSEQYLLIVLSANSGYRVSPVPMIRFEQIEQIYHRTSGVELKCHSASITVGLSLIDEYGVDGYEIPLQSEADVARVTARLMVIFRENADPFFRQFSCLAAVDSAVNDHRTDKCNCAGLPVRRCSTGLIVAKLTGRKNYDELVSIYHAQVKWFSGGFYLPQFEALLKDLESVRPLEA